MPAVAFCFLIIVVLLGLTGLFLWRERHAPGPWND